ncbi:hypothetical protein JL721_5562 [Aureococcus anophagefferens]|nr:hypothetical protein JL721_5562 [Aureococcus anophagefferens]
MSTSATSPKNTPPNADLGGFFPAHRGGLLDDSDAAGSESGTFGPGSTGALDACRELQTRWESRDRSLPAIKATEKAVRDGAKGCAEAGAADGSGSRKARARGRRERPSAGGDHAGLDAPKRDPDVRMAEATATYGEEARRAAVR